MKKLLLLTILSAILLSSGNYAYSAEKKSNILKAKTEKTYVSNLYSVAKFFNLYQYAANNYNLNEYLNCYSKDYLNSDGFNRDTLSQLVKDTCKSYPGIKYQIKLNNVTFDKGLAVADITEVAKGYARVENDNVAEFVSTIQSLCYLKPNGNSWIITCEYTIKENVVLSWGDAKLAKIQLNTPNNIQAGSEYSAILNITHPEGVLAIGSITSDKIIYPQNMSKEIFRKFSPEGTLERLMKANTDNTNELVVGTVGFTRPKFDDNQNLDIKLTGYACLMERINVIPINKFIEVKNDSKESN